MKSLLSAFILLILLFFSGCVSQQAVNQNQGGQTANNSKNVSFNNLSQNTNDDVITLANNAWQMYKSGNAQGALKNYDALIEKYPNTYQLYEQRGEVKDYLGDYESAIVDYDKALELNLNYALAYHNRGSAKFSLKDCLGAIDDYNKALEIDPSYFAAYDNRGIVKGEMGDNVGAINDATKAIELNPNDAFSYSNRAYAKILNGDLEGAKKDAEISNSLDAQTPSFDELVKVSKNNILRCG